MTISKEPAPAKSLGIATLCAKAFSGAPSAHRQEGARERYQARRAFWIFSTNSAAMRFTLLTDVSNSSAIS